METNKRGFFGDIKGMFVGLVRPVEYMKNGRYGSWGAAIAVAFIFAFLTSFLTVFLPCNKLLGNGKLAREIENKIVNFRIDDDGFYCESRYEWLDENGLGYICIDTDRSTVDHDEIEELIDIKHYRTVVVAASKEAVLYSNGELQTVEWEDIFDYLQAIDKRAHFDKQLIVDIIDRYDTPVVMALFIFCGVISFLGFMICCALWGGIGEICASIFNISLPYESIFKAAVYIRAIWYIIKKLINTHVLFGMGTLMWIVAFVMILVYLILSIYAFSKIGQDTNNLSNNMYNHNDNMYNGN